MKGKTNFFIVFIIIYYLELGVLVKIVLEGLKLFKVGSPAYNDVKYTSTYALLLWIFEFYSAARYSVIFQIEGLIQLISLKIFRYFCFFGSIFELESFFYRFAYTSLDFIFIISFLVSKDSTLELALHKYNLQVGTDVGIRNAFIVS